MMKFSRTGFVWNGTPRPENGAGRSSVQRVPPFTLSGDADALDSSGMFSATDGAAISADARVCWESCDKTIYLAWYGGKAGLDGLGTVIPQSPRRQKLLAWDRRTEQCVKLPMKAVNAKSGSSRFAIIVYSFRLPARLRRILLNASPA